MDLGRDIVGPGLKFQCRAPCYEIRTQGYTFGFGVRFCGLRFRGNEPHRLKEQAL